MKNKKFYETREFISSASILVAAFSASFFMESLVRWSYAVSAIASSYIVSKALFKKDRSLYSDSAQSEIGALLVAAAFVAYSLCMGKNDLENSVIALAIVQVAFNLSRGHTKSLPSQSSARTMVLP